jgi:hypothetical protein
MFVNGLGAVATATTVAVVTIAKFATGAWVTTLLIPTMVLVMISVRHHYDHVEAETANPKPLDLTGLRAPLVVVPILYWNKVAQKALRFALNLSSDVHALHIAGEDDIGDFTKTWNRFVDEPARAAGLVAPHLVVLNSPYRFVISPIVDYVLELGRNNPNRQIAVLIPELVERHWYHYFLHNQRAEWLKELLLLKGNQQTIVIVVPWHLSA